MKYEEFDKIMNEKLAKIGIKASESKIKLFYSYMINLIEWNEKINLTAIVDEVEIIDKHFIDSLTVSKYINDENTVIDVGTGAGFPGIPLKIERQNVKIELLDSLNKRINFLNEIIKELNLTDIKTTHGRAEDEASKKEKREQYDVAVSRAVASLPVLLEYLLPFVKIGGICICMKGNNIDEELNNSKKALDELGGQIEKIDTFQLPDANATRNIIIIRKTKQTPIKYPRKAGTAVKLPLI